MTEQQQTLTSQQAMALAVQHHNAGRLSEAEKIYQQILQSDPNQPVALHLLGVIAHQTGENDTAVELITKALTFAPDLAEAHSNLGAALLTLGRLDEAVTHCKEAITIKPDFAEAHNNLGNALKDLGKVEAAVASYRKALDLKPDYAEAHYNQGNALRNVGNLEKAVANYRQALAIKPDFAEAYYALGNAFQELGKVEEAATSYRQALALKPDFAEAHINLGNTLQELGKVEDAVTSYHDALTFAPDLAEAHSNLGAALLTLGRLDEAVIHCKKSINIKPEYAEAHNNLGNLLRDLGKLDDAVASFRRALVIKSDYATAQSNLLLTEQYRFCHNTETLYKLHCEWDQRHGQVFRATWPEHPNIPEPDRRLRIGFVSPDLGRHPVGFFIAGLLENLRKSDFETVAYSDRNADDLTERIKNKTDMWRSVHGISHEELTKTILDDTIDILVDLTGHSARNRLLVFARKPAPLQVTWAGYVGTTGLSAIDYLLSDIYSTRPEEEKFYTEEIIRMPDSWLCYDPPDYAPSVSPLPFKQNGLVTFGSFSNPAKLNAEVLSVWAQVLNEVTNSRLLIKYKGIDSNLNIEHLSTMFEANGINRSRLKLEGWSPHAELLARYNDVDIGLDPFPYSGGLTTYEALWMGVPILTVPGKTFASRHSLSHLSTVGLPELVARDQENYVELAVELARDTDRLTRLRAELREKVASSPICNGKKFAKGFGTILRKIWRDWCLSQDGRTRPSY